MDSDTERAIADFARRVQRERPIPGLGVAVAETADSVGTPTEDPATYAEGFGARDLAGNRPATGDTLFGVGAVTEPITAAAILQLSAAGLLNTSDPLADHLGRRRRRGRRPRADSTPPPPDAHVWTARTRCRRGTARATASDRFRHAPVVRLGRRSRSRRERGHRPPRTARRARRSRPDDVRRRHRVR
ncbi:MAG: serine hydrolase, partial [Halobaculum sp.]